MRDDQKFIRIVQRHRNGSPPHDAGRGGCRTVGRRVVLSLCCSASLAMAGCGGGGTSGGPPAASSTTRATVRTVPPSTTSSSGSSVVTALPSSPTAVHSSSSSSLSAGPESASDTICALVHHRPASVTPVCKATNIAQSKVDPAWFVATVALYDTNGQPASDVDRAIVNVSTRTVVGPTNVGFCGVNPDTPRAIGGYAAVPTTVLASLGLQPCATATATPPSTQTTSTVKPPTASASLVGSWGGHEIGLTINASGVGRLNYADLRRCPSCSMGSAPRGSLTFKLTTMGATSGSGSVTASSDPSNYAVGQQVDVTLAPASPGEFLQLRIGSTEIIPMCNAAAAGQCGA